MDRPHKVDFHLPMSWIGGYLTKEQRPKFAKLKFDANCVILNYNATVNHKNILIVIDNVNGISSGDYSEESMSILSEFVSLLRVYLLSKNPDIVARTAILCDTLVKNCGSKIHILIGRRKFMKTMSIQSRRFLKRPERNFRDVALLLLDTIQAWGEAFYTRRILYPHIYGTYRQLRVKYGIQYPRPDNDPTRVPIFLGPITSKENQLVQEYQDPDSDKYESDHEEDKIEKESLLNQSVKAIKDQSKEREAELSYVELQADRNIIHSPSTTKDCQQQIPSKDSSPYLLDISTPVESTTTQKSREPPLPPPPPPLQPMSATPPPSLIPQRPRWTPTELKLIPRPSSPNRNNQEANPSFEENISFITNKIYENKFPIKDTKMKVKLAHVDSDSLGLDEEVQNLFKLTANGSDFKEHGNNINNEKDTMRSSVSQSYKRSVSLASGSELQLQQKIHKSQPPLPPRRFQCLSDPPLPSQMKYHSFGKQLSEIYRNYPNRPMSNHMEQYNNNDSDNVRSTSNSMSNNNNGNMPKYHWYHGEFHDSGKTPVHRASMGKFIQPSSDPTIQVQYFGQQRVASKRYLNK